MPFPSLQQPKKQHATRMAAKAANAETETATDNQDPQELQAKVCLLFTFPH